MNLEIEKEVYHCPLCGAPYYAECEHMKKIETTGQKEEKSEKWKRVDKTVKFIQENWKGFFHTHPQENGRFTPEGRKNYLDLSKFFLDSLKMKFLGVSPHAEKAYPEEIVINPKSIEWHLKKFQKEREKKGRPEKEISEKAIRRYLKLKEYHKIEDVEKGLELAKEFTEEKIEKEILKGTEIDIKVKEEEEGFEIELFTPVEKLRELSLDYLIISVHPEINPKLKEVTKDPEKLTKLYTKIADLAGKLTREEKIKIFAGHPLSRCEAKDKLNKNQKEEIISAFAKNSIPIEISLNEYYMKSHSVEIQRPSGLKEKIVGEENLIKEFIPLMDNDFLELIKKYDSKIYLDTDLHFGDWVKSKGGSEEVIKKLEDLYSKKSFLAIPHFIRGPIARFTRIVQRLLEAEIKPENILNTWSPEEIKKV